MENTTILLSLLNLTKSLNTGNTAGINAEITTLNAMQNLTADDLNYIKDYFKSLQQQDEVLVCSVIDKLTILTEPCRKFLIALTTVKAGALSKEQLEIHLTSTLTFESDADRYLYYSLITRRVVEVNNPDLLQKAIDKLQSNS